MRSRSLMMMLAVVKYVAEPPKRLPYATGMSSLLGLIPVRRAASMALGSFAAIGLIGLWLRNHRGIARTVAATLAGSVLFFIVTNFGVWVSSQVTYPHTLTGLIECYAAAVPFFRNTLAGDLFYVGAMFGLFEFVKKFLPSLSGQSVTLKA